jgi:hypothetical protein
MNLRPAWWLWEARRFHAKVKDGITVPLGWSENPMFLDIMRVIRAVAPGRSRNEIKRLIQQGAVKLDFEMMLNGRAVEPMHNAGVVSVFPPGAKPVPQVIRQPNETVWIEHGSQLQIGKRTRITLRVPFWNFLLWGYPI